MSKIKEAMTTVTDLALSKTETDCLLAAAQKAAGFEKILKFRKGDFLIGDEIVPSGTQYLAHTSAWSRCWIKFADGNVAEKRVYSVAKDEKVPERHGLDANDQTQWPKGKDGKFIDPWLFQQLLPLEDLTTGEIVIFTTPSIGGEIAIADLVHRHLKSGHVGQPIVELRTVMMPTRSYGDVPRPAFYVVGWDGAATGAPFVTETSVTPKKVHSKAEVDDDMADEIPF